jgi:hypothetical protein
MQTRTWFGGEDFGLNLRNLRNLRINMLFFKSYFIRRFTQIFADEYLIGFCIYLRKSA